MRDPQDIQFPQDASIQRMGGRKGWARKYVARLFVTDVIVLALVMVLAHAVRFGWDVIAPVAGPAAPNFGWLSAGIVALWVLQLGWSKSREARILGHGPQEFQRVISASWRTFAIIAIVGFLTQWQISRGYLLFAIPVGTLMLLVYRGAWRTWIHAQRDRGELRAQVIVVGPVQLSQQLMRRLRKNDRAGLHILGVCLPPTAWGVLDEDLADIPVLGTIDDAAEIATRIGAEYLIISGTDELSLKEARQLGWELEGTGTGLIVAPAMADIAGPRVQITPVEGMPLLHVDAPRFAGGKYVMKAVADEITAFFLLLLLALPLGLIALAVKLTSRGPVLFKQVRVGRNEQLFTMYKFRSMYVDAEARLAALKADDDRDAGNDVLFKMRDDPRVTKVGKFLRRYSLDELPQLLNVFKGDMAIVGPRPPLPSEVESWEDGVARRQLVKPGITGLWQVSGRSDLDWEQSVRLDLYYTENWSLAGDFVIVLRTAWAVLAGRGAY
ncbi:sugar transferase [Demequina sp. NBRC 110056]|uniref:sugar transferase n=1 Tax=Demequina sp. NBRC 110056 TaxID=1570345 RepID=UPI001180F538|nr:sugar transferase [Demequina sp. NBRC 110056]